MSALTIRADGIDWPLQTYLDAMRYRRVDPFDPPELDAQIRVATVSLTGELAPSAYASQVRWYDVMAFRPIEHGSEAEPCEGCGEPVMRLGGYLRCEGCEDDGYAW